MYGLHREGEARSRAGGGKLTLPKPVPSTASRPAAAAVLNGLGARQIFEIHFTC